MKPAEHKISDASFVGHYFKILLSKLKQFKTAKHVVLSGMVLVCLLTRYIILLGDKNQVKTQSVTEKYQKGQPRIPQLVPNSAILKQNNYFRFKRVRFNAAKTDVQYFLINEVQ